jgi:L-rhamnose mutarotase
LKDDSTLIKEYIAYHVAGKQWPEITKSIKKAGITDMQIYLTVNRRFMIKKYMNRMTLNARKLGVLKIPKYNNGKI